VWCVAVRLRAPFLRIVLRNAYMELELEDIVVFAEVKKRGLYAEIYMGDVGYIYEKGDWHAYDGEGKPKVDNARRTRRGLENWRRSWPPCLNTACWSNS
jgi:hypothetical protein